MEFGELSRAATTNWVRLSSMESCSSVAGKPGEKTGVYVEEKNIRANSRGERRQLHIKGE